MKKKAERVFIAVTESLTKIESAMTRRKKMIIDAHLRDDWENVVYHAEKLGELKNKWLIINDLLEKSDDYM